MKSIDNKESLLEKTIESSPYKRASKRVTESAKKQSTKVLYTLSNNYFLKNSKYFNTIFYNNLFELSFWGYTNTLSKVYSFNSSISRDLLRYLFLRY